MKVNRAVRTGTFGALPLGYLQQEAARGGWAAGKVVPIHVGLGPDLPHTGAPAHYLHLLQAVQPANGCDRPGAVG